MLDKADIRRALGPIEDAIAERLAGVSDIVRAPAHARIFSSGDACAYFLALFEGRVRVELTTRSGRDVVLYRMEPGVFCVLTTSCLLQEAPYSAQAVAETDCAAIAVPAAPFREALARSPALMNHVLGDYAGRVTGLVALIDRLASRGLKQEIAALLIRRAGGADAVEITHEALARELGSAREAVSRRLADLERDGALTRARGAVVLRDRALLERLAASSD